MAEVMLNDVPKRVRDMFNKGFGAFERGNLDYAIDLFLNCVELEPRLLQARKFLRAAEIRQAQARKSGPLAHGMALAAGMPTFLKAKAMLKTGKVPEALMLSEKLLRKDPLNLKFLGLFYQTATAADLPEAAILTLESAREQYPDNVPIIHWLGGLYLAVGRTRSAKECFERLCEIAPNDPDALKALKDTMAVDSMSRDGWERAAEEGGTFREMVRDSDEAALLEKKEKAFKSEKDTLALIAEARAKIDAEPENMNYYRALARLEAQQGQFQEAIATIGRALEISPGDPELDNTRSNIRRMEYDDKIATCREAGDEAGAAALEKEKDEFVYSDMVDRIGRYPNDLRLRYDYGTMLLEREMVTEAIQQFQLSQRSPKHRSRSLYYLAMCFKSKGQYDLAMEQLETAASEIPSMNEDRKDICYEIGAIAEQVGDAEKAAENYKRIYQVDIGYKDIAEKVEQAYNK